MTFSRLMCARWRLRCSVSGVTSRWIFGHLLCVLPSFSFVCGRGSAQARQHQNSAFSVARRGHDHFHRSMFGPCRTLKLQQRNGKKG